MKLEKHIIIIFLGLLWSCRPTTQKLTPTLKSELSITVFGAFGDGKTDVTEELQLALDNGAGKEILWKKDNGSYRTKRLKISSGTKIVFEEGVEIEAIGEVGGIFLLSEASNVQLIGNGAKIIQSRATKRSTVYINGGANNVFDNFIMEGTGKDGIYLGPASKTAAPGKNHIIRNCTIRDMKRQGISVVHATGTLIENCRIFNTHGARPAAGIDLEENPQTRVDNTTIRNCYFEGNPEQAGIAVFKATNSLIQKCTFKDNFGGVNLDLPGTGTDYLPITNINSNTEIITVPNHNLTVNTLVGFRVRGKNMPTDFVKNIRYAFRVSQVLDKNRIKISWNYSSNETDILKTVTNTTGIELKVYTLDKLKDIIIEDCEFIDNRVFNIYAEQASFVTVRRCKMTGGGGGINLVNTPNTIITDNELKDNTSGRAIFITDKKTLIKDNVIINSKEEAIEIQGTECSLIEDNKMINCGEVSSMVMFLKYTNTSLIRNNTIQNDKVNVRYGIVLDKPNSFNNELVNNSINIDNGKERKRQPIVIGNNRNVILNKSSSTLESKLPCEK